MMNKAICNQIQFHDIHAPLHYNIIGGPQTQTKYYKIQYRRVMAWIMLWLGFIIKLGSFHTATDLFTTSLILSRLSGGCSNEIDLQGGSISDTIAILRSSCNHNLRKYFTKTAV